MPLLSGQVGGMPEDRDSTSAAPGPTDPVTPGLDAREEVAAVPAPGSAGSSAGPGVRTAQGASPEDGIHAGEKSEGSDSSVTSPGAWTAIAAPGKPDGEVDTRS